MLAVGQPAAGRHDPLAADAGKRLDLMRRAVEGGRADAPGRTGATPGPAPTGGVAPPARAQRSERPSGLVGSDLHHCPYSDPFPANLSDLSSPRDECDTDGSVSALYHGVRAAVTAPTQGAPAAVSARAAASSVEPVVVTSSTTTTGLRTGPVAPTRARNTGPRRRSARSCPVC